LRKEIRDFLEIGETFSIWQRFLKKKNKKSNLKERTISKKIEKVGTILI